MLEYGIRTYSVCRWRAVWNRLWGQREGFSGLFLSHQEDLCCLLIELLTDFVFLHSPAVTTNPCDGVGVEQADRDQATRDSWHIFNQMWRLGNQERGKLKKGLEGTQAPGYKAEQMCMLSCPIHKYLHVLSRQPGIMTHKLDRDLGKHTHT